jgi:hypothetical protein
MLIKKEKSKCHIKTELGVDKEDGNNLYSNRIHKITLKAHFQLPNASGHEFKPKAGCSGSKKINSNQFVFLSDLHGFLEQLCSTTMCGVFDLNSPPAIRMLDYLGDTGKYCTRSNVLSSLPSEFVNISRDMVIDVGVGVQFKICCFHVLCHKEAEIDYRFLFFIIIIIKSSY